jgi:2-succinyl-6-hydroxy-2,4-cyclohexadiene-1-carboxylate synthase
MTAGAIEERRFGVRALCWGAPAPVRWVLLHGFTQRPESFAALASSLGQGAAALALELPGHGGDTASGQERFEDAVAALAAPLGALEAPVHLVGYSLGARLALGLLLAHPASFARATLIGVHPGLEDDAERERRRSDDRGLAKLLREQGLDAFLARWEALPLWSTQGELSEATRSAQRAWRRAHHPMGLARSLETAGLAEMPSTWPRLGALAMPVQLVVGARDAKFRKIAERMLPRLPSGTLAVVPDAGHNVPLEAPAALAALLRG